MKPSTKLDKKLKDIPRLGIKYPGGTETVYILTDKQLQTIFRQLVEESMPNEGHGFYNMGVQDYKSNLLSALEEDSG